MVGEVAADIIRKQLYGKEVKDLTEEEKQTISALSQLAAGLAVAAGGGNFGDASAAISSSKNAVENNYLWLIRLVIPSRELSSGMLPIAIQSPQLAAQLLLVSELQLDTESAKQFVQSLPPGVLDNIVTEYRDDIFKEDMKGFSQAIIALYDEKSKIQGYPIPEPLPTLPGYEPLDPDKLGPNHTGHDEILQPFEPLPGYEPLDPDKLGPNHTGGDEILEKDWRDFILTNQDKSFVDYKGDLNKGDQIDLSKFTDRQKISGGKANYVDPKTGWILSPDRAGANSHGGSAWKLIDKKGNRIATLDKNGNVLRK